MTRLRSIPPITSTGGKRNPNARFPGLAQISLGRYLTERRDGIGSFGNSEPLTSSEKRYTVYKPKKQMKKAQYQPPIEYDLEKMEYGEYLLLILTFIGQLSFTGNFTRSGKDYKEVYGQYAPVYYTSVQYGSEGKEGFLILSTIGDVLESEVVPQKKGINRLFYDEKIIPELNGSYNPLSMVARVNNGIVTLNYSRNGE